MAYCVIFSCKEQPRALYKEQPRALYKEQLQALYKEQPQALNAIILP